MTELDPAELEERLRSYESTIQHLELLSGRITRLIATQLDAERQLLHRAGQDYAAGRIAVGELLWLYKRYRDVVMPEGEDGKRAYPTKRPGFSNLWNDAIPVHSAQIGNYAMSDAIQRRYEPNQGENWCGTNPLEMFDPRPRDGQAVVYVLFDDENVPCYVGSSEKFKVRLDCHTREKKFARWAAYPCADRQAAYRLEDRLLREHKPYMNKRAGR